MLQELRGPKFGFLADPISNIGLTQGFNLYFVCPWSFQALGLVDTVDEGYIALGSTVQVYRDRCTVHLYSLINVPCKVHVLQVLTKTL